MLFQHNPRHTLCLLKTYVHLFGGWSPLCKLAWTVGLCMHTWQTHASANTHSHKSTASSVSSKATRTPEGDQGRFCISLWKRKTVSMSRGRDGMLMKPQKRLFLRARFPSTSFHISGSLRRCAWGVYAGAKTRQINWWHWKANEEQQWVMTESGGLVSLSQGNASNTVIGWNENNQMRSCYRAGGSKRGTHGAFCPRSERRPLFSVQWVAAPLCQTTTAGHPAYSMNSEHTANIIVNIMMILIGF